jgi:LmbE family N-acetylglucosaminyl deacetylase
MKKLFLTLLTFIYLIPAFAQNKKVVLAIFAHPDDEITVSPLLAKLAGEGSEVYLAIATDGQNGVTPFAKIPAGDSLARKRKEEAICAAEKLKIHTPIFFNLVDGSLYEAKNHPLLKQKIQETFKSLRPDVVLTWGAEGGYGHPDHRMVSNMVTEVFQEGCENCPGKLFYAGFPIESKKELPLKTLGAIWLMKSFHFVQEKYLTYQIPFSENDFKAARESYACHQSQYLPDTIDEIFRIVGLAKNKTYLRPFVNTLTFSDNLFK